MSGEDDDPGWFAAEFDDDQAKEVRKAMGEAIAGASPSYGAALRELESAVEAVSPFDLICFTAFYFLTGEAGANPEYNRPEDIFQHHVEAIHAFALRRKLDEVAPTAPLHGRTKAVLDAVKASTSAFTLIEMARVSAQPSEAGRRRAFTVAAMRTHAATVRGWSYYTDLSGVLADLYAPLAPQLRDTLGVSPVELVAWWWAVTEQLDQRIAGHRQRVHDILVTSADGNWPEMIRDAFPRLPAELDATLVARLREDDSQREVFTMVVADLNLYQVFGVTIDDLKECYPGVVERGALEDVLNSWSLNFGDTGHLPIHELIQDNPVVSRPLVKLGPGMYLWTIPAAFNHSAFTMLERLFSEDAALSDSYTSRRAVFLEEAVADQLAKAFSNGRVLRNLVWTDPSDGKEYETDVLTLVGSHALIAECKSGRISRRAQRGRGRSFRDDVEELIVQPAQQAQRFADYLRARDGIIELSVRDGPSVTVDAGQIRAAFTIGVTLEPFAGLLPRIGEVLDSGLTEATVESLTHSLTLFDLLVVLEMLEHPSDVLHYVSRRAELERSQFLLGDETDLLGFYLLTGFNLGGAEFEAELQRLRLIGLSDKIDTYHYALEAGELFEKPRVRRTPWWEALITMIEERAGPRWTELGVALCNVAWDEQREFEQAFEDLRGSIRSGDRPPTDFVLFTNGPPERRNHFIGLVLGEPASEGTRGQIADAARQALAEHEEIQRVIVIGWPPIRHEVPYHTLALFERPAS